MKIPRCLTSRPLSLRLLAAPRLEDLAEALSATLLRSPLTDPFAAEWLLLPHGGMKAWLEQYLSEKLGIWSHAHVTLPEEGLWACLEMALPASPPPRLDYDECLWLIFNHLDGFLQLPALVRLQTWLERYGGASARMQLAQTLAGQLELLMHFRPEALRHWSHSPEPSRAAQIWHFLCQLSGGAEQHRAALLPRLASALTSSLDSALVPCKSLPQRLTLFACDTLPPLYLDLLCILAQAIPITWYLSAPLSLSLRQFLAERGLEPEMLSIAQPLSLSQALPDGCPSPPSLLQSLQAASLGADGGRSIPGVISEVVSDPSVQIHITHGPLRELEVLHDYLLSCFAALPDLRPGEIAVLVPQLEAYAPLIEGVFFRPLGHPERLPFRIAPADPVRSPEQQALRSLFELSGSRLSRDEVLGFLEQGPVARRFGFDPEALAVIAQWLEAVEIRWGWDAEHRGKLQLPPFGENSWKQGLKRLLLGFALADEGHPPFAGLLPYPAMEGHAVHLLGQLLDFFQVLEQACGFLAAAHPPETWSQSLPAFAQRLFSPRPEERDDWHLLLAQLADIQCLKAFAPEKMTLAGVRAYLERRWHQAVFRDLPGGLITFASPSQLQGVPFRVLCFLGLNSGALPRADQPHELDLLADAPHPGDPSQRQADRQLFLQTLLSARDRLFLSYTGRRLRDNLPLPPSLLLSELQEKATALGAPIPCFEHPLQPFSAGYFQPSAFPSWSHRAFTEAQALLAQHRAPRRPRPFVEQPLPSPRTPAEHSPTLPWLDFLAFFKQPSRAFLKQRLGLSLWQNAWQAVQSERFQVNALELWRLREDYLQWRLRGLPAGEYFERLRASQHLPLGQAGERVCLQLQAEVEPLAQQLAKMTGAPRPPQPFVLPLGSWELQGELAPLFEGGLIVTRLSALKAADRLQIWLTHLLLGALGQKQTVMQIGLSKGQAQALSYAPVADAASQLQAYLQLYEQGLQSPLPLALESAWEWFRARDKGADKARSAAENRWWGNPHLRGEAASLEYALCLPDDWMRTSAAEVVVLQLYSPLQPYLQEAPLAGLEALGQ